MGADPLYIYIYTPALKRWVYYMSSAGDDRIETKRNLERPCLEGQTKMGGPRKEPPTDREVFSSNRERDKYDTYST